MSRARSRLDWPDVLDFDAALQTLHYEMHGDWYRDPWGWPELDWLLRRRRTEMLVERLNSHGVKRAAKIDVPKENFGTRPAIVMDPLDRLIYQALVDRESVNLVGGLRPWVYGWRLVQKDPSPGRWSHNDLQHSMFRENLSDAADDASCALRTDIVSFFASVEVDRLSDMIESRCGRGKITDRINDLLHGWDSIAGRKGLAQRSSASAALANMHLGSVDDVLKRYQGRRSQVSSLFRTSASAPKVARWMDDIWVFGNNAGRLRQAQLEVQDALRDLGLEMNYAKTELLEGDEVVEEAKKVQHSAVDAALLGDEPDPVPLLDLVAQLLDDPARAERTSVKFATRRMRDHKIFGPVPEFVDKAERMPHVADALARLFRDSSHWHDMGDWYVDYAGSPWGSIRWSVAQFGTMFPSRIRNGRESLAAVEELFMQTLHESVPLPLLGLAAQRLAAWNSDDARVALREAANTSENPQYRRVLALALAGAGEEKTVVQRMLSEFEENAITREMLADRQFRVKVKSDFDGS